MNCYKYTPHALILRIMIHGLINPEVENRDHPRELKLIAFRSVHCAVEVIFKFLGIFLNFLEFEKYMFLNL
jgi:hypothetical protein